MVGLHLFPRNKETFLTDENFIPGTGKIFAPCVTACIVLSAYSRAPGTP